MNAPSSNKQQRRGALAVLFGVAGRRQSYLNILYLLAAFPLGLFYFVFLVAGLSVGIGLVIIWIGIPILMAMIAACWGLAAFERASTRLWLKVDILPMPRPAATKKGIWNWFMARLGNATTWKNLSYLLAKLPFGIISFCMALTLVVAAAALILAPFGYLLNTYIYNLLRPASHDTYYLWISVDGRYHLDVILSLLPLSFAGIFFGLGSLHLMNGMAYIWGQFARVMLGMSMKDIQLSEAMKIAEQERARAGRADQSRKELIVNVSHELRTPIASIRGHVESLLLATDEETDNMPDAAELRNYLNIVYREAERLNTLVDDLLSLARAESDELRLDIAPTCAAEVIEEVYAALAPLARRERQVTVVREVAPNLPWIMADRQRLAQVLLNLMRNAITYTPTGGIVSIALNWGAADRLALIVADTGMGIPTGELESVFERFYRTDASRARTSGGFGLGLTIVRDLVQAMGGSITAESKVGEGSRFRVLLPIAPPQAQAQIISTTSSRVM